jgi:hypothetical protein
MVYTRSIGALQMRSDERSPHKRQRSRFLAPTRALKETRASLTVLRNDSFGGVEA